jgi:hypothetical protein
MISLNLNLFPDTLLGDAKNWLIKSHKNSLWSNIRSSFIEKFGDPKILASWKGVILGFKQKENDTLTDTWERFRVLIKSMHALSDWIILQCF